MDLNLPFRSTAAAIRLIVQLRTVSTFTSIRLVAESNQPVLQLACVMSGRLSGLVTVSNQPVLQRRRVEPHRDRV